MVRDLKKTRKNYEFFDKYNNRIFLSLTIILFIIIPIPIPIIIVVVIVIIID